MQPPQPPPSGATDPTSVADAIAHVKSGVLFAGDFAIIVNAKSVEAVPVLEDRFAQTKDARDKATIAIVLVQLGDKDGPYWKYLTESAASAIDADSPDIVSDLSRIKSLPPAEQDKSQPPPALVEWAKAHNMSLGDAAEYLLFDLPGAVFSLGATGDPRAIPLLRRALLARNPMIQVEGAMGLAQIRDNASVPLILAACKRGTADLAKALAMSLIYFDDPQAQQVVDQYFSKKDADEMRKEVADHKGPFDW